MEKLAILGEFFLGLGMLLLSFAVFWFVDVYKKNISRRNFIMKHLFLILSYSSSGDEASITNPTDSNWKSKFQEVFSISVDSFYENLKDYANDINTVLPNESLQLQNIFK